MAETKYEARLKTLYNKEIAKQLQKELGLENINQVPKLEKVMVSSGVGKKREDKRFTETVELTLTKITGQAVTPRLAKKSIAQFKIRKGMGAPVGYVTTLRNDKMYEFIDRLVNVALVIDEKAGKTSRIGYGKDKDGKTVRIARQANNREGK